MPRKRLASKLHLPSTRQVQTLGDGDHSDGAALTLRIDGDRAQWVFRYTAATGSPIEERDRVKAARRCQAEQAAEQRMKERLSLARAARDYHARVIEAQRTDKHAAQWLSSLENHIPPKPPTAADGGQEAVAGAGRGKTRPSAENRQATASAPRSRSHTC